MHFALIDKLGLLSRLKLKFPREEMEQDYRSLREKDSVKDFKISLLFLLLLNILSLSSGVITQSWTEVLISGVTAAILILVLCIQKYLTKYLQLITLGLLLVYSVTRLILVQCFFEYSAKTRIFYTGHGIASVQTILVLRLILVSHKMLGMFLGLTLRFVYISVFIEPESFDTSVFLRQCITDIFIVYTFFGQEKMFRKVYQDFRQKEEELLKFKELLANSLPQSLAVVTYKSNDLLFSNKAFENIFKYELNTSFFISSQSSKKSHLNSLLVDSSTLRKVDANGVCSNCSQDLKYSKTLGEILQKLSIDDYLNNKTISLSVSMNQRVFEVTIKKVKWDCEDAMAILFNDITYQEKLMALKLANVNKDKVIATVSHELRTPLNGIIGILEITEKKVNDPEVGEYLSLCKDNAHLLLSLVNSILDLQQISAGKLKLNPINVDIRKVLRGLTQLFYFQCNQKNISLECNISEDIPLRIFTDENRLKQIIINLVSNAIKFTCKGGINIQVVSHPQNPENIQISVIDTGIGIKQEDLKHLFKMYGKIEDGESVNKNGVGLGLTISNALVSLLNGNLENQGIFVESEYGVGTKFSFEIPRKNKIQTKDNINPTSLKKYSMLTEIPNDHDNESTRHYLIPKTKTCNHLKLEEEDNSFFNHNENEYNESFSVGNLQSKMQSYSSPIRGNNPDIMRSWNDKSHDRVIQPREVERLKKFTHMKEKQVTVSDKDKNDDNTYILIVDDNPFNLLVATNLVRECGYKTKTALSGQDAIDLVKDSHCEKIEFKAIFMDCQMPIMDGFETTKVLKTLMDTCDISEIPILGWTANNSEEDVKRCYEAGMVGHLPKPATKLDFSKAISML